jgi:hypothetical protein
MGSTRIYLLLSLLLAASLTGCNERFWIKKFTPEKESALAQRHLDDLRSGKFRPVQEAMDQKYKADLQRVLPAMRALFPKEGPKSVKVVGSHTTVGPSSTTYSLTYEYEYSRKWLIAQVVLQREGQVIKIAGLHVTPLNRSIESINGFNLSEKSAVHYIFLIAAMSIFAFVLWTVVVCWRTPMPKRKWLWIIFVLLGVGTATLNWTSGDVRVGIFSITLFGVGFMKPLYGALMLQIGLPIGAAVFWFRRKKWSAVA